MQEDDRQTNIGLFNIHKRLYMMGEMGQCGYTADQEWEPLSASVFRMREEKYFWRMKDVVFLIADDEPIERMVVSKTIQNHF